MLYVLTPSKNGKFETICACSVEVILGEVVIYVHMVGFWG